MQLTKYHKKKTNHDWSAITYHSKSRENYMKDVSKNILKKKILPSIMKTIVSITVDKVSMKYYLKIF